MNSIAENGSKRISYNGPSTQRCAAHSSERCAPELAQTLTGCSLSPLAVRVRGLVASGHSATFRTDSQISSKGPVRLQGRSF